MSYMVVETHTDLLHEVPILKTILSLQWSACHLFQKRIWDKIISHSKFARASLVRKKIFMFTCFNMDAKKQKNGKKYSRI